ncbi:MAG: putative tellurite resistance protein B-like protein [Myxococcota bacterium]|jgi:uncharacterized tellurite resistance protein B-like protein
MLTDDELELAFAYHMVQRLIGADDNVHRAEIQFLEDRFPTSALHSAGFVTADGTYTDRWRAALDLALAELTTRLDENRKVRLIRTLLGASLADADFDAAEGSVLLQAATLLGLEGAALDAALNDDDVGDVDLPEPEA